MWRLRIVVVLLVLVASAHAAVRRATWLWNNSVLDDAVKREDVLRFCRARRIDVIFLYAPADHLRDRAGNFRSFLAAAHGRHVQVQALDGAAGWQRQETETFVGAVRAFNDAGQASERFDAIHLDVEPYDTAEWKEDTTAAMQKYLALLESARSQAAGLPLAADVPPWFGELKMPERTLLAETILRVDELGLMAYTDQTKGLEAEGKPAVEFAAGQKKKVWIGVSAQAYDTDMDPNVPLRDQVEHVVKRGERLFDRSRGFRGVAIHDYEHLRALYPTR